MSLPLQKCVLCTPSAAHPEELIYSNPHLRIIFAAEPLYPCFVRVIWNTHAKEMTDLAEAERSILMRAVFRVETAMRSTIKPDKINIASFGNMVAHVHWHIVPRWCDDAHWPQPTWGMQQHAASDFNLDVALASKASLAAAIKKAFEA